MSKSLNLSRLTATLLMAVILLQAILPLAGVARSAGERSQWIKICASAGTQWLKLTDNSEPGSPATAHADHPCAFCIGTAPPERFDATAWLAPMAANSHGETHQLNEPPQRFAGHRVRARAPPFFA